MLSASISDTMMFRKINSFHPKMPLQIFDIDLQQLYTHLVQLGVAFVLPMFTAWNRETEARSAGVRTFPLVSMAACSFTLLAMTVFDDQNAQGKIIAGIITGIGFIGGGAILKDKSQVSGTSTAAAVWSTGAVGIAAGLGRLEIAIALSFMTFITFKLVGKVKQGPATDSGSKNDEN